METDMNRNLKVWLFLVIIAVVVIAFFAAYWAVQSFNRTPDDNFPFRPVNPPPSLSSADIEFYYIARTVVSTVNIVLLVALVLTYANIYIKTRSTFTIGLLIFALVFLMKDITASPFIFERFGFSLFGLGPFALLPELFELAALSVLLYLSTK